MANKVDSAKETIVYQSLLFCTQSINANGTGCCQNRDNEMESGMKLALVLTTRPIIRCFVHSFTTLLAGTRVSRGSLKKRETLSE